MDSCVQALFDELVYLPLIGETSLRAFCSSISWQIYEARYLLLREQGT
jgi:hypothetical protein